MLSKRLQYLAKKNNRFLIRSSGYKGSKKEDQNMAENQLLKMENMADILGLIVYKIDSTEVFEALLKGEDYKHFH